jgi:hypothetical protein
MIASLLLAACSGGPVVSLEEAAGAKGAVLVEAELKSVTGAKAVLGDALEVTLPAKHAELKVGERYVVKLSKKTVSCIEAKPYRCGEGASVVPVHALKETGVVEAILRSKTECPRCPATGKCEPCTAKVVLDSGDTVYLHGELEVPALGTRVRLGVRRVAQGALGFPAIEATCVEPAAK